MKKESSGAGATHENQELRSLSRSHIHEKKSSGAGAVLLLRQFRSPGFICAMRSDDWWKQKCDANMSVRRRRKRAFVLPVGIKNQNF